MSFMRAYWWAILAIGASVAYLWHVARRGMDLAPVPSASGSSVRAPAVRLYLVLLAAAALIVREIARRFPLLLPSTGDYAIAGLIGVVAAVAFAMTRAPLFPGPHSSPTTGTSLRFVLGFVFGAVLGGSTLVIANGSLDSVPARDVRAIVASTQCGDGDNAIIVSGVAWLGSALPGPIRITRHTATCREVAPGDSVSLAIRPGFFARPWIQEARVETAQVRVQQLLDRRLHPSR